MTGGGSTTTLTWNGMGYLKSATTGGSTVNYAYNGVGQRVGKTGAVSASYVLADDAIDSQVLSDGASSYAHGAAGLVSELRAGTSKFYHGDSLGSVRAITNGSGAVTDAASRDAFGMPVASSGTTPTPFGFAGSFGYQQDAETGLMRLGHRMYDASAGRFVSRDPIQDGYNWYSYCEGDAVNWIDPEGLEDEKVVNIPPLQVDGEYTWTPPKPSPKPGFYDPNDPWKEREGRPMQGGPSKKPDFPITVSEKPEKHGPGYGFGWKLPGNLFGMPIEISIPIGSIKPGAGGGLVGGGPNRQGIKGGIILWQGHLDELF